MKNYFKNITYLLSALTLISSNLKANDGDQANDLPSLSRTNSLTGLEKIPNPIVILTNAKTDNDADMRTKFENTLNQKLRNEIKKQDFLVSDDNSVQGIKFIVRVVVVSAQNNLIACRISFEFYEPLTIQKNNRKFILNANIKSNDQLFITTSNNLDAEILKSFTELTEIILTDIKNSKLPK